MKQYRVLIEGNMVGAVLTAESAEDAVRIYREDLETKMRRAIAHAEDNVKFLKRQLEFHLEHPVDYRAEEFK